MTLCFFSTQYLPTVGGVERYTWNLAKRTVAAGHRAIVVTSALHGLPEHEIDPDGIEIYRLPVWPVMRGRFPVLKPSSAFRRLSRQLWANSIDFCIVQTKMYVESVWATCAAKRLGIPTIVIDHSTGYMPMGSGLLGLCGRLYEQAACGMIKRCAPTFYGVSGAVCDWLAKAFHLSPAGCLPNAVDPEALDFLTAGSDGKNWRSSFGLAPDTRLVAYVGRLIPEKGAGELAKAVAELPNTALIIAGDGPMLADLKQNAPKNVFCPGSVPYADTIRLLQQADVYCLPTRYGEGFPTTLLEAAACRCPILCTRTAGTDELLPGPEYGVLLDSTEPAAIRDGLLTLLEDPALARRCAERTYANLCEHFTWDAVYTKLMSIVRGC